ncbi:MAG: STAS domain-containing protein [Pirellulales bacterium]|nr:STAS domain-containing protein [Pirellulales bacterium]
MLGTSTVWHFDVDRGPDWVFVTPVPATELAENLAEQDHSDFADTIWEITQLHQCSRVVVELGAIPVICSTLLGQLIFLAKRVHSHGGILRLTGLSATNQSVLHTCRLESALPSFSNRADAVKGYRPIQPR